MCFLQYVLSGDRCRTGTRGHIICAPQRLVTHVWVCARTHSRGGIGAFGTALYLQIGVGGGVTGIEYSRLLPSLQG